MPNSPEDRAILEEMKQLYYRISEGKRELIHIYLTKSLRFQYMETDRRALIRWLNRYERNKTRAGKEEAWKWVANYLCNMHLS